MMIHLAPNEQVQCTVNSRPPDNALELSVHEGEVYDFEATGLWSDGGIKNVGPGGFWATDSRVPLVSRPIMLLGGARRRVPQAPYFALIGELRTPDGIERFLIGESCNGWTAGASGELYAFANDLRLMYFNNEGTINLLIRRTR
jgi:hypothetical protein